MLTFYSIDRGNIVQQLREVIDPELGVNIVDLGLVYNIFAEDGTLVVEYTATTPGCPMRRYLQQQIEAALATVDTFENYEARLVWEPEWSVEMIENGVDFFGHPPPQVNDS
ncbi:metal-sulfur cluster assembly factor [Fodinibius saliphilus]|uniref:metal-sulfur cluster assembly factor n=1 Tax=Fodinibius saliphilus TaxID=1920650 RepID=UPI0011080DB3|nr:metal-sulfur cluster assembly factor [Fodinibius saliphilus]